MAKPENCFFFFFQRSSSIILITLFFLPFFRTAMYAVHVLHFLSAKILYEMHSFSYSMRVSGFSIHLTSKADDGSPIAIDKVSTPYNRFGKATSIIPHHIFIVFVKGTRVDDRNVSRYELLLTTSIFFLLMGLCLCFFLWFLFSDMVVHELHRKDAKKAVERISCTLLNTAAQAAPSTSTSSTESGAVEFSQTETVSNGIANKPLEYNVGPTAASATTIDDVLSSDLNNISESSISSISSSPSAAPALTHPPSLTPDKDPKRMSLQKRMHKKNIERKMSACNEMQDFPPIPMSQSTTFLVSSFRPVAEVAATVTLATISDTVEVESQTNIDSPPDVEEAAPRCQFDIQREENRQDNLMQTIAKRLINAPPLPRDALEAYRRLSQSGDQHQDQDENQSQSVDANASLENLQILAAGTLRRVKVSKKGKDTKISSKVSKSIRPSSILSVAASIRPASYIVPPFPSMMWPNYSFTSSTSSSFPSLFDTHSGSPSLSCSGSSSSSGSSSGSESKKVSRRSAIRRVHCSFDNDPSIYCSARAQAKYLDGRGEICRITAEASIDPAPSSTSPPSSAQVATTKPITWPKEFIMPNNYENGKPMYNSVAEHEYARMVNALVALERLDSVSGSKNRFPKELLDLLPRILNFLYEKDILFGLKTSPGSSSNDSSSNSPSSKGNGVGVGRDKLHIVRIANTADIAAVYNPPGLFEGIEAVFTHGQLTAQGSLVTNRQRRGIVSVSNFQKSGFSPPYEEDMKGLFVEKVSCSFWNAPSSSSGEGESGSEGVGKEQGEEAEDRKRKTASNIWPFKRKSKLSTTNTPTTTFPAAILLESLVEVDEDEDRDDVGDEGITFAVPASSIAIHGKHPVPYPLLNHAIENGLSCGNRYMVLLEASPSMLPSPFSASLTFSQSTESLGANSASVQCLNGTERSSAASTIPTTFSAAAQSVAGTRSDAAVVEKSGSLSRMTSQLKAKLKLKTKKNKNKATHEDDDEQVPDCLTIEELIEYPSGSDHAFSMTPLIGATTVTETSPGLECFLPTSSASISSPSLLTPPPPRMPLLTQLPTLHKSSSSLSLSLSLPRSATTAHTTASQGVLVPEDPKVCQRGWTHFMKTIFAFETNAIKASAEAATAVAEASSRVNLGLGLDDCTRTSDDDGRGSNNNSNNDNRYTIQEVWPTQKTSFSTIKFKDSTYFHVRQQRSITDAIFDRSDSIQALESLVCISKTLQNAVVVQEVGGTIVTPEIFLGAISERQQEWQRGEDARLEEIEMKKEKLRIARVEATERQEREQEERRTALKLLREQLEEHLGCHQKGKRQALMQKDKQRWYQENEIREIPPEVPPKDYYPAAHPNDGKLSSSAETDTGAGVRSTQDVFSQSKSHRSGSKLKNPSFFTQLTSAILDTTTTATTTSKDPRSLNLFQSAPQSSSLTTPSSASQSYSASTAPAHRHHGRTPAYLIRGPDDDILYSAPGLQRDPLPSELPDHILFPSTTTTGARSSPFDSTMIHESEIQHRLGTMIAPALPSYGVRLTNPNGTKTLAQEESERIEREMHTFWKGLEALCEPPEDRRISLCAPPGIALLSISELESHVEIVERYVEEMRNWRARFLFHQK